MSEDAAWVAATQDDLPAALAEFRAALPGWWYSMGECHVSCHASCGPDSAGVDRAFLRQRHFDYGFNADLPPPASMADALRDVMQQGLSAKAALNEPIGQEE